MENPPEGIRRCAHAHETLRWSVLRWKIPRRDVLTTAVQNSGLTVMITGLTINGRKLGAAACSMWGQDAAWV